MKPLPLLCIASALGVAAAPAAAVQMQMPGMKMPPPAKPAAKKKAPPKKAPARKPAPKKPAAPLSKPRPAPAPAQPMTMPMPTDQPPTTHEAMPMPAAPQMNMPMAAHGAHAMAMTGALGPYAMQRESSGTAWQPDSSRHMGLQAMSGGWTLMAHGLVNLVYDHQSGARGDDKAFVSGMWMGMASHPLGNGMVQFKAMLSPDPLMGPRGYPLLLASGETANGRDRLIDRQHPHDLFMELSGSLSQNIGA
ncbi:MAG TPA: hypothetical protein VIV07_03270, partial [Sphingomicrobium sp.]